MKYIACGTVLIVLFNCASIPKSAPALNQRVSDGIDELKVQHLCTLDHIYSLAVERVDGEFDKYLKDAKEIYVTKNGRSPRTEEEYYTVCIIAVKIREEILQKIQNELARMKLQIERNYDLVEDMNDEVTRYLNSAVKVKETEQMISDYVQQKIGIDLNIDKQMQDLDEAVDRFIEEGGAE